MKRGIFGTIYDVFTSSFFFVNKTQQYPNKMLHNSFGFVTAPIEHVFQKSTKKYRSNAN